MDTRTKERLGGLFIAAIGAGLAGYNWYLATSEGRYYLKSSFIGPACVVIGLALLVIPSPKTERETKGLPQVHGMAAITPIWWTLLVAALLAGGANMYLLGFGE